MKHKKRKQVKFDKRYFEQLVALKSFVENINGAPDLALRSGIYKGLDRKAVFTTRLDGVVFGYKLEEYPMHMVRNIYVKFEGYDLDDMPEKEKDPIMNTVFETFLDKGQSVPNIRRTDIDTMLVSQMFMPMFVQKVANN